MKISILLPYKENFSENKAGAVSLYVRDVSKRSKFKKNIKIYGETSSKNVLLKNFIHLDISKKIYLSKSRAYIYEFIKKQKKYSSDIIEIHNRPSYIPAIKKNLSSKIFIYFHNDPLQMKGSIFKEDRIYLLQVCKKIIFNSKWCQSRFFTDLNINNYIDKISVIPQSTSKTKVNFNSNNSYSFW